MTASALLDELEKQFAENPRRVFAHLANEYRKSGSLERAIEICQAHVPQQSGYISGYVVLGQALFENGQADGARRAFETALELDPENLIALRQLGDIARQAGDIGTARAWYTRLLEVDPQGQDVRALVDELPATGAPGNGEPVEATTRAQATEPLRADTGEGDHGSGAAATEVGAADRSPGPGVEEETAPAPPQPFVGDSEADGDVTSALPRPAPYRPAADGAPHASTVARGFVTETMAELYLQQGFTSEALGIYRRLIDLRPDDTALRNRVAEIERRSRGAAAAADRGFEPADRQGPTIRSFFNSIAARRPPQRAKDSDDDIAARTLAAAFSEEYQHGAPLPGGQPVRAASDELSLDAVFRDAHARAQQTPGSDAVSFDEFFAGGAATATTGPAATPGGEPQADDSASAASDLAEFQAWLEGLKK